MSVVPGSVTSTVAPVIADRRVQLLLLAIAMATSNYARSALSPLQESVRLTLSLSDNQLALLQGPIITWPVVLAALPLGLLVDRHSRARLLFLFVAALLLGTVATAFASNFATLLTARCFVGIAAAAVPIAAFSLIADLYAPQWRGRAKIIVAMGELAGASAVFALGGFLLSQLDSPEGGWHLAMLGLAVPLVLGALTLLALRDPPRAGLAASSAGARRRVFQELWRHRAMMAPLLAAKIMVGAAYGAVAAWAVPTFVRGFGMPANRAGSTMAIVLLIGGITGPIAGGALADLCHRTGGPRRTFAALSVLALLSVPVAFFALMPTAFAATTMLVVFMTLVGVIGVAEMTLATIVIPNELRGVSLSVLIAAGLIFGVGLAPLTVSVLSSAVGGAESIGNALCIVCAVSGIVGAASFAWASRNAGAPQVP